MHYPRREFVMTVYSFTIQVGRIDPAQAVFGDRFYGNGVDDALIYVIGGNLFLAFDREAENEESAIRSAMHDIAVRGGSIERVTKG